MQPQSDAQLLRAYAEHGAEAAFTELVQRHTNLVYSAALRQVESPDVAAEITQNVFVSLARGAKTLVPGLAVEASLAGWLCRCARNLPLNHRRDEFRRQTRERQAMEQLISISDATPDWEQLRRVLDDAMAELSETDYDALVLRFYQGQDYRTVGATIGVNDDTAQKRVSRALDKLRDLLAHRGVRTTASALSTRILANAVQAAPVGLAVTISAAALAGTAVTTSALIATTTKAIAMTALQKTLVTATVAVLLGTGIYQATQNSQLRKQVQALQGQQVPLAEQIRQLQNNFTDATNRLANVLEENVRLKSNSNLGELLKLRGEVGALLQENSILKTSLQTLRNPQSTGLKTYSTNVVPREDWGFAGYNTPSATVQSMIWAKSIGDFQSFLNSVTPTITNDVMNGYHAEQSLENAMAKLLQETKGVKSLQIVGEIPLDENTVIVQTAFQVETGAGESKQDTLQMVLKRTNGEWKYSNEFVPRH